jgi:hypothetical protein
VSERCEVVEMAEGPPVTGGPSAGGWPYPAASMFLVTTSILWLSRSVGLNSTSDLPARIDGVRPGPMK